MEKILKSELLSKSAISIGVFDIIEQIDDVMVIIKSDERTKLKFFNGELDILMHGQSHYRIKGIRSGGLMLAKAEIVDDSVVLLPELDSEPLPEYSPPVKLPEDNHAVVLKNANRKLKGGR